MSSRIPLGVVSRCLLPNALVWLLSAALQAAESELPERRLSPEVRQEALPAAPLPELAALQAFFESRYVLDADELAQAPYLLGNHKGAALTATGDLVYARGSWPAPIEYFEILRPGEALHDPRSGALLGVEAEVLGLARLLRREGERASLRVESSLRELRPGDRLLPKREQVPEDATAPAPVSGGVQGRILAIRGGLRYGGSLDSLLLDIGKAEGLLVGQRLQLREVARRVDDPLHGDALDFPGEPLGTVLVYRVFAGTSLALVLDSSGPIRTSDLVVLP